MNTRTNILVLSSVGLAILTISAHPLPQVPPTIDTVASSLHQPEKGQRASSQKLKEQKLMATERNAAEQIRGYKHWKQVNAAPKLEVAWIAYLCRGASPQEIQVEKGNPHNDKYIVVYVNDVGKNTMMDQKKPHFPVGSLIVKEKRAKPDSTLPELCTVMLKREAGYNAKGGDWEYFVTNGTGTRINESGIIAKCAACHAKRKETDFVYRGYLAQKKIVAR